ncbi:MBL fold metallo-hydrolase [Nocardioides sp. SR21]|uniref:MBL fold metallo-hydrolase n=1 Tax=Nocardioides sp. SR21 TaxID=2919501 RepID=UPI001FA953AD|nr:MBL fold metallo-hydrolase [Nocardioides sp. SR21]
MDLVLLGVRGSTPAPGPGFVRYGGHTSCVAVVPTGATAPTLLLDAGTGIGSLGLLLGQEPFRGSILLSHLHWDHVQGLPFCRAVDRDDSRVDLHVPVQDGVSARDLLARMLSPPSFPIEPEGLLGRWRFLGTPDGTVSLEGFEVTAAEIEHKGGRTMGFRVADAAGSFAYLPDHAPARGVSAQTRALVEGVDVLLHDAQFTEDERSLAGDYGHATVQDAVALADDAGVGRLVLFHHSPVRTDAQLDRITDGVSARVPLLTAREGMRIPVCRAG